MRWPVPPAGLLDLSIVVPVYNEQESLPLFSPKTWEILEGHGGRWPLLHRLEAAQGTYRGCVIVGERRPERAQPRFEAAHVSSRLGRHTLLLKVG